MKYKIKKDLSKEEGRNEFDSIIEISGLHSDVTVNNLLDHLENTQRVAKEQASQIEVNKVMMAKAVEALPILKDIPEDQLNLVLSYSSKFMANKQAEELIKTCEETVAVYTGHLKAIEEQTGIKCIPVSSPYQPITIEQKKANG